MSDTTGFEMSLRHWRLVPRLFAMLIWLIACVPAYYLRRLLPGENPVPPAFLGGIARIARVRIDTDGPVPDGRAILLANHLSWLDILVLASRTGTAFVAHDGLAQSGFIRWLCEMNNTLFIERSRRSTIARQVEQLKDALSKSRVLTLFPEGTTSDGKTLLPLKSALLAAIDPPPDGVDIQPVFLDYSDEAADIAWGPGEPGTDNFLRVVARAEPLDVTIRFFPPLSGTDRSGRKAIAAAVGSALRGALARQQRTPSH